MRQEAHVEEITVQERSLKLRWKLDRHGEYLAWVYVAGASGLFQDGVGFEARASSPEEARAHVVAQVEAHLAKA
jgi:hypothetical protein